MLNRNDFLLLTTDEFKKWLQNYTVNVEIKHIQLHHTEDPSYSDFTGENHYELCSQMEASHIKRGFGGIAQNFTIFPDGLIAIGRSMNDKTIGIKGANKFALNIENIGNFDIDNLTDIQSKTIVKVTRILCDKYSIRIDENCVIYHHWYDLETGYRITDKGRGKTKTCPGKNFFGGNTYKNFKDNLLPLLKKSYSHG